MLVANRIGIVWCKVGAYYRFGKPDSFTLERIENAMGLYCVAFVLLIYDINGFRSL